MDSLDSQIIELLTEDARMSKAELARRLDTTDATVGRHLERLINDGVIRVHVMPNYRRKARTVVGIYAPPNRLDEIQRQIHSLNGVAHTWITSGRYSILAWVEAETIESLDRLIADNIATISGVDRTETHMVLSRSSCSLPL